ncbi:MAG: transketolase [Phycisphaerae bacterium]|nr:transketolase [Phycisphaerae bacterium]
MPEYKDLDRKVITLSKQVCRMCTEAGSGHPSSGLALAHLTTALMYRVMRYEPQNPWNTGADRLVLSEGHAVPVVYAAYCDLGGVVGTPDQPSALRFDDALTLREADSVLDGHPNPAVGFPFFDAATGSLGQGLSVAAGLAAAARLDGSDKNIYCVIGDGESREGQIWEAVDFLVDHKLTAVRAIFSCNGQGQSDYVSPQQQADVLARKLEAYGCDVRQIDGHDWDQVFEALTCEAGEAPIAIVARTVKGWGVNELQAHNYHGKPLKPEQLDQALADLDAKAAELGIAEAADAPCIEVTTPQPLDRPSGEALSAGTFAAAAEACGLGEKVAAGKLATRRAYGVALAALGADPRVVALDGDVKNSTFAAFFAARHADRYFEGRIAEQNMVSAAAGLAASGRIPFVSSFAKFLVRAYDQIEMACITNANVKLCGSHAGVSLAADGPSQMGLPDMAFFRALARSQRVDGAPSVRMMLPSDAISAFKLTELMANVDGMCYMRTHRPDVAMLYDESETFEPGGFKHLEDGEDVAIVASGYMVHVAREAMALLEEAGLSASLIDAYSIPLQTDEILRIGDDCRGQLLVVEDNYLGGIADEITAAAATSDLGVRVQTLYADRVPKSVKTPNEALAMVKLTPADIAQAAQAMFDQSA